MVIDSIGQRMLVGVQSKVRISTTTTGRNFSHPAFYERVSYYFDDFLKEFVC